jgi:peptide/nickel transport system ATP-binding protein
MEKAGTMLLSIEGLRTIFEGDSGNLVTAVDGISLAIERGTTIGIVGESGCGKSALSLSIMGLLPENGRVTAGRILLEGDDIANAPVKVMRSIRGKRIAMIFQEPMSSLNPLYTIGSQIAEALQEHERTLSNRAVTSRIIDLLHMVKMPAPERRLDEYPHQLSGGMRQRVMIAMALACEPDLLIADEPTTALDVTVQAQILDLLRDLQVQTAMAMLFITHDLGVVAEVADHVCVMYAGQIIESASTASIFENAQHPYTLGLLGSRPNIEATSQRLLAIDGSVPLPGAMPDGCRFHPRCVFAAQSCTEAGIPLRILGPNHSAACIRAPIDELILQ